MSRTTPAARGGKAKSMSALVIRMDQVNRGSRRHVMPFALFFTMVVMKLTEDIVTEAESIPKAKIARVVPG